MHRAVVAIFVLSLVGCDGGEVETDSDTDPVVSTGTAPVLTIEAPAVGDTQNDLTVTGMVVDPDQPLLAMAIKLKTSVGGRTLWEGNPDGAGDWTWTGGLALGTNTLTASTTDLQGNTASASVDVVVGVGNLPPNCSIVSPADHASFSSGRTIILEAWVNDPDEDEVALSWTSDIEGLLMTGALGSVVLTDGIHVITLAGDDGGGESCSDSIDITVGG